MKTRASTTKFFILDASRYFWARVSRPTLSDWLGVKTSAYYLCVIVTYFFGIASTQTTITGSPKFCWTSSNNRTSSKETFNQNKIPCIPIVFVLLCVKVRTWFVFTKWNNFGIINQIQLKQSCVYMYVCTWMNMKESLDSL